MQARRLRFPFLSTVEFVPILKSYLAEQFVGHTERGLWKQKQKSTAVSKYDMQTTFVCSTLATTLD